MQEKIIILDFGSQTTQLIGRRVRELDTYCEILPYNKFPYGDESIKGVILSGSPFSVYDSKAFKIDLSEIRGKYPILGICYGAQFLAYSNGGKVESAQSREYGRAHLSHFCKDNILFKNVRENTQVWMSHGDTITAVPENFKTIASTDEVAIAAYQIEGEQVWGVQFHPEVFHTEDGTQILRNFVVDVCGCKQDWSPASFIETTVARHCSLASALLQRHLECLAVIFAYGLFGSPAAGVDRLILELVHSEMLYIAYNPLFRRTLHTGGGHFAENERIFGVVFEISAAERRTMDVKRGSIPPVHTQSETFLSDSFAEFFGEADIPCRTEYDFRTISAAF